MMIRENHTHYFPSARVVKLADTPDLGSGAVRREGSSPSPSTIKRFEQSERFVVESSTRFQRVSVIRITLEA